jgi:hypothetical protein
MTMTGMMLAEPDPIHTSGAGGLADLAKQGILGTICVLLIVALVWVTRNWKGAMEARIADAKGYADALKGTNEGSADLTIETNRMMDALKAAFGELKTEVSNRKEQLQFVLASVEGLKTEQGKFIAVAQAKLEGGRSR